VSRFAGKLDLIPDDDALLWQVVRPFYYDSDLLQARITIPAGFWTDGASVPRPLWGIIPPWGRYGRAAVIHDYLYRWRQFSRRQADDALLEGMWVSGCASWQFATIFTFVRLFGNHAWRKDEKTPLSSKDLLPNDPVVSLADVPDSYAEI
jgi:hypothetical protein